MAFSSECINLSRITPGPVHLPVTYLNAMKDTKILTSYLPSSDSGKTPTEGDDASFRLYLISGSNWFSSITDANMSIVLARTPEVGISAFRVPIRRTVLQSER